MKIQKIFSNVEDPEENLYSVLMDEEEYTLFSKLSEENKGTLAAIGGGIVASGSLGHLAGVHSGFKKAFKEEVRKNPTFQEIQENSKKTIKEAQDLRTAAKSAEETIKNSNAPFLKKLRGRIIAKGVEHRADKMIKKESKAPEKFLNKLANKESLKNIAKNHKKALSAAAIGSGIGALGVHHAIKNKD